MKKYLVSKYLTLSVVIFRKPVLLCMAQWVFWINFQMVVLLCWYNTCTHAKRTCMYNFLLLFVWIVENKLFFFFLTHNGEEYVGKDFRWKIKGKERIDCLFSWFKSNSHLPKSCFHLQQWKPFKMMKNAFYFTLNAIFVLKMFNFLSWPFWHAGKRIVKEAKVNFKICDVADWATNN